MTLRLHGLARSHDKLKPLYLCYHRAYSHQTMHNCNLPWGAHTNKVTHTSKVTQPFYHMALQDPVTNLVLIATKLGRVVTYLEGILPIKQHNPLITWSWKITWETKDMSSTTVFMATKLATVLSYLEGLLPMNWKGF